MNTEIEKKTVGRKLDSLSEELRISVLEMSEYGRLTDVVDALKGHGIDVSIPTLSRHLQRDRERRLLEDGNTMKTAVVALAERGRDGALREGSMEAVRQRLYERVLMSDNPEETLKLYNAMLKEEGKLKELELEGRKVKVAEEQVRLQAIRLAADGRRRVGTGTVVESRTVEEVEEHASRMPAVPGVSGRERQLLELVGDLAGILNRGGMPEEKVLAARQRLGAEQRLLGEGSRNDK